MAMQSTGGRFTSTTLAGNWIWAGSIAAFATIVRLAFFSGGRGSDEITYTTQALKLLSGDWGYSNYIGAIRYGINGALALSIWLFGHGVPGSSGIFFLCSIGEILLVYWFAQHLWGQSAAIWSGLALATLPISVYSSGALVPDPYLALFIDGSLVVFYFAQRDNNGYLFFLAGILAGWVFWIKESVILFGLVFVFQALAQRRLPSGWFWFLLGGSTMLAAHALFFWLVYSSPFFVADVLRHQVANIYVAEDVADTSAWTYFLYLFQKIYDAGLVGWLVLAGSVQMLRRKDPHTAFVLTWGLGLLFIFSAFPISFSPLKFIAKQVNYMAIFMAPFALISGRFVAEQPRKAAYVIGGAMVLSGIIFSARDQYYWRSISANGRIIAAFAQAHPEIPVFAPLEEQRQSQLARVLRGSFDDRSDIKPVSDFSRLNFDHGAASDIVAYFADDPHMWGFLHEEAYDRLLGVKLANCATPVESFWPTNLGLGRIITTPINWGMSLLPVRISDQLGFGPLQPFANLEPATIYAVTRACAASFKTELKPKSES